MNVIATLKSLVIEGWRGINHSFVLIARFRLLEILQRKDIVLHSIYAQLHFTHRNRSIDDAGFHADDEAMLTDIQGFMEGKADWQFRIFSPLNILPLQHRRRLAVFAVTECGLDSSYLSAGVALAQFEEAGGLLITPLQRSLNGIIDFGFWPETVRSVPSGASTKYIWSQSEDAIVAQRVDLGIHPEKFCCPMSA